MTIVQAIVLGLLQGITEFAPISSSGHLILVPWLFGWPILENPDLNKSFDVFLHLGTLLGAVVYFRRDVGRYVVAFFGSVKRRSIRTLDERMAWALVVGTIPGVIAGATFENVIQEVLGAPWLIAVSLGGFGILLWWVDRVARNERALGDMRVRDGLILGTAQALALQPGVSRSGVTITTARLLHFDRETAARVSFLLALPIIAGAGTYKGIDLLRTGIPPGMGAPFIAGFVASAASGFLTIWFLLKYLRRHNFTAFMVYRLAVAGIALVIIASGIRAATA